MTAWLPLANGVLTAKYHGRGLSPGRMSADMMKQFMPEQQRTGRILASVRTVSDDTDRSMAQVALAWLRHRPVPVILLGAAIAIGLGRWLTPSLPVVTPAVVALHSYPVEKFERAR